jgi:hypothetical protein
LEKKKKEKEKQSLFGPGFLPDKGMGKSELSPGNSILVHQKPDKNGS